MFSTHQQSTYSFYNFGAGNRQQQQQYNEPTDPRWNLEDPRFVSTAEEQLWQLDEPVNYENLQYDARFGVTDYGNQASEQPQKSFPQYTSNQQGPSYEAPYTYNGCQSDGPSNPSRGRNPNDPTQYPSLYPQSDFDYRPHSSNSAPPGLEASSYPSYSAYPPPPSFQHDSLPRQSDPRLLHGDQHDPTLSARYQPSFENLPTASNFQATHLARPPSLNSLKYGSDRSHPSPPRSRPSTGNEAPPSPARFRATPRRLNSNLSISVDRASLTSRSHDPSPTSSSGQSHPTSPYRSLPSPLSPARKRPHSSHYEVLIPPQEAVGSSLVTYSIAAPQYAQGGEGGTGSTAEANRMNNFEYASSRFVENYALERGIGELQLASRPSSSSTYPTTYPTSLPYPPTSFDSLPRPPQRINASLEDTRRVRESEIRDYLRATDKLQAGERTVLVLNPRIAQRSYGTERRLLNPPPMAYLLGTSWHSSSTSSLAGHLPSPPSSRQVVSTPDVHVSIYPPRSAEKEALSSKESCPTATWMAPDGKTIIEHDENAPVPISGRFVSKSLAVSLDGDLNKDTVSDVRTVVTVFDRETRQMIGTFLGKPITVISKPSKKKSIMAGGTAGLVHGGLVALFNRAKAGSGSTRYLCTSGPQANFPTTDWKTMTSNAPRPFAPNDTSDVRFISKTHSWDAFVIYTVDLSIPASGEGFIQLPAPQQGYPKPPLNIVPVDTRKPQALYYNQPVVLQCLATGVVSPVLILRRIDTKTIVIGGGSLEPPLPNINEIAHLPVAPGERIGEPVSQYKNVAFEVYQASPAPRSDNPFDRRLPTSSFLGCINDEIGIHVAEEEKTIHKSEAPLTPPPSLPRNPLYASTNSYMPVQMGFDSISEGSSDDSDSKRKRARTSTTIGFATPVALPPSPASSTSRTAASRHKRRGQSLSSLAALKKSRSPSPRQGNDFVWTVPCGESGVWSILAIDLARHTFFVPPSVDSMPMASMHHSSYPQESSPIPSTPIGPVLPSATRCEVTRRNRANEDDSSYAVLHGDNFDTSCTIWVGDQPCSEQTVQSSKTILFRPAPAAATFTQPVPPRRISIVRFDGVVFPTNVYYRD
ncbi:hypothetical protein JCM16303_005851 [Sporobolomyces ruberrimus]